MEATRMSDVSETQEPMCADDWPTFPLRYTFNPEGVAGRERIDPDELVVFDPGRPGGIGDSWVTAERGSYVCIEDVR